VVRAGFGRVEGRFKWDWRGIRALFRFEMFWKVGGEILEILKMRESCEFGGL
jgi:hypothetical protein